MAGFTVRKSLVPRHTPPTHTAGTSHVDHAPCHARSRLPDLDLRTVSHAQKTANQPARIVNQSSISQPLALRFPSAPDVRSVDCSDAHEPVVEEVTFL